MFAAHHPPVPAAATHASGTQFSCVFGFPSAAGQWVTGDVAVAYGGVAPLTKLASKAMAALQGRPLDGDALRAGLAAVEEDVQIAPDAPGGWGETIVNRWTGAFRNRNPNPKTITTPKKSGQARASMGGQRVGGCVRGLWVRVAWRSLLPDVHPCQLQRKCSSNSPHLPQSPTHPSMQKQEWWSTGARWPPPFCSLACSSHHSTAQQH